MLVDIGGGSDLCRFEEIGEEGEDEKRNQFAIKLHRSGKASELRRSMSNELS